MRLQINPVPFHFQVPKRSTHLYEAHISLHQLDFIFQTTIRILEGEKSKFVYEISLRLSLGRLTNKEWEKGEVETQVWKYF